MEAKELRIGNWVTLIKENIYDNKDYQLDAYDIYKASEFDDITECLRPIPLNEEWLLKFGFNIDFCPDDDDVFWYDLNIPNEYDLELTYYNEDKSIRINDNPIPCKYVHQLQNLYFALTNEELVIL